MSQKVKFRRPKFIDYFILAGFVLLPDMLLSAIDPSLYPAWLPPTTRIVMIIIVIGISFFYGFKGVPYDYDDKKNEEQER